MTFKQLHHLALECHSTDAAQALLRNTEGQRWKLPHQDGLYGDARVAIGYAAGYEDRETQLRLWNLFDTEHFAFAPNEKLSASQLLATGWRIAARVPEHRERIQKYLDDHDFAGLRAWFRTPLPGDQDI